MRHGIEAHLAEIERFQRRLSGIGIAVALALLAAEFAARSPAVVAALNDPKHFGFEGPEQYVQRIQLEQVSSREQLGANAENFAAVNKQHGGGDAPRGPKMHGLRPAAERQGAGPGTDDYDLISRVRALALEGPVVRSEELVVEKLVRPEYPDEARDHDIEGIVELVALVDTTGAVAEVHIMGGTGHAALERAATSAVLQCRYRPYKVNDVTQRVWAFFRVSFSLY